MRTVEASQLIARGEGQALDLGSLGARHLLAAAQSQGHVAVVEHWIAPRTLAAPLHRHSREDEWSFVLAGRMGAQLGDATLVAEVGDFVLKPRGQWHTFWNPGDVECRLIEIISPGGFAAIFDEIAADPGAMAGPAAAALDARYGIDADYDGIAALCAAHGLTFPA